MLIRFIFVALAACIAACVLGQGSGKPHIYMDGSTTLEGFLALPKSKLSAPGVLIVHDWDGLNAYEKRRAEMIADLGYVALAVDIYGKGVRPKNMDENRAESGKYRSDPALLRGRLNAALKALENVPGVDRHKIAIMGYCFGGSSALELARSGADIKGAVSIHGSLGTTMPASAETLKARVLVLHGSADPNLTPESWQAFSSEMKLAKADWQFVTYGGAVHSFSNPGAGNNTASGNAYDPDADRRSWEHLKLFLAEIFK